MVLRNVEPFDERQWKQLQEDQRRPLTEDQKTKMARIRKGAQEITLECDLEETLSRINQGNIHHECDTGPTQGREKP